MTKAKTNTKTQPSGKSEAAELAGPGGKLGVMVGLMTRPEGASVAQLVEATGWLPHSVRGALAGSLKKKHGLVISSAKEDEARIYRVATGNAQ